MEEEIEEEPDSTTRTTTSIISKSLKICSTMQMSIETITSVDAAVPGDLGLCPCVPH